MDDKPLSSPETLRQLWEELGLDGVDVSSLNDAPPPISVSDMIKAAEDAGISVWWDNEAQAVKMSGRNNSGGIYMTVDGAKAEFPQVPKGVK